MTNDKTAGNVKKPSHWEWLPVLALFVLIAMFFVSQPGSLVNRFSLFVGLGLLPGSLCRLLGRPSWGIHRIFFAVSLVAFVLDNPDLRPDGATLGKMAKNWHLVGLGFIVSFTQTVWGTVRIHRLLTDSGIDISAGEALKLCLKGAFFNLFLPGSTGGDAYRVYAITQGYGARLGPAIASVSLDRFLGLPSLILVVAMGMLMDYRFFLSNRILAGLIPFISIAGVVCLVLVAYLAIAGKRHRKSVSVAAAAAGRVRPGWFRRLHDMIATNVKSPATLPLALFYGFLAHIACIASCQLFGMALGVEGVPPVRYYLIVPLAMTINAIPGAPGGIGQGELAMATLLDMASPGSGNAQDGVMIMLLFRLSNIAVGLLGGVYYALGKREPAPGMLAERLEEIKRDSERILFSADANGDAEAGGGEG